MAAATVTRTISSAAHTIAVTATGGAGNTSSIAQVYTAVVAIQPTAMSYDSGTNTYTLHRLTATYSYFYISGNCTVQIPQDTTFINQGFTSLGAINTIFYVSENGKLILNPGSRIKFSSGGGYVQLYGVVTAVGTEAKPIIWQSYRQCYCYSRTLGAETRFQWVTFKNITYSNGYYLYFSQYNQYRAIPMTFKNVKFTNDNTAKKYGNPFYFTPGGMYTNVDIDGFQCDYTNTIIIYGCSVKLKNGIIKNCAGTNIDIQGGGNVISAAYQTSKDDTTFPTGRFQSMVVLQNIQFDNLASAGSYAIYVQYNSLVCVKNCKFSATNGIIYCAFYSSYGSVTIQNNNDITALLSNSSRKSWVGDGTILHGHQLDLTVLDQNNQPANEATVTVIQKSNPSKQRWSGLTKENGKLLTIYNDNPVYIQKEQTSLDNFEYWSDPGHTLMVNKPGYKPSIQDLSFTEDKTVVVKLRKLPERITEGNNMEYEIIQALIESLSQIQQLGYIGEYPYDFQYISNKMPAILIKYGDAIVDSGEGHTIYTVQSQTEFILYTTDTILRTLQLEQLIIKTIIQTLHDLATQCISQINDTTIQTGDVSDYLTPSDTGYNANIKIRKITQNYKFRKIIT